MGTTRRMTTKMGTTAFNWSQPPKSTTSKSNSVQSKLSGLLESTSSTSSTKQSTINEEREIKQDRNQGTNKAAPVDHNFLVKTSEGTVHIQVLEARNLKDDGDKLNPVAVVHLGSKQLLKTKKVKKSSNPIW